MTGTDALRRDLCKDLIADVRRLDQQLAATTKRTEQLLDVHGTSLREIDGIGPVLAARLLGRTGRANRFPDAPAYANYTGTAPVQIASADANRHRVSRYGDRQLNSAIHTVAMVQVRMRDSAGRAHHDKKIADGKSPRAASRSLKRHLAHLWRVMLADEKRARTDASDPLASAS